MKRAADFIFWLLPVLCFLGCAGSPETIADLYTLPQDATFYLDPVTATTEMVSRERQQAMHEHFLRQFFLPWCRTETSLTRQELVREFSKCRSDPGYGENLRQHTLAWYDTLARNASLETFPNAGFRGITIYPSNLRRQPTSKPHFSSLKADGSAYPFDNFQNSALPANTPVYVTHVSRDQAWVLVESHYAAGWLPARDVVRVDENLMELWQSAEQLAIIRDEVPVSDEEGRFLFKAGVGAQFPQRNGAGDTCRILVVQADEEHTARLMTAILPAAAAGLQPLALTPRALAEMANQLMNQPYGWGGLYQNRDCSSLLKDLFAPFGIWLPRHSAHQALAGGTVLELGSLNLHDRERMIRQHGIPFLTLLWARGHIMLYLGHHEGHTVVFHTFWGIKTRTIWGREGRKVVGHTAITSLHPGAELSDRDFPGGDLLHRVEGMTVLKREPQN